jgi:hypothetical protein
VQGMIPRMAHKELISPYHDRQLLSGAVVQGFGGLWGQADRV